MYIGLIKITSGMLVLGEATELLFSSHLNESSIGNSFEEFVEECSSLGLFTKEPYCSLGSASHAGMVIGVADGSYPVFLREDGVVEIHIQKVN